MRRFTLGQVFGAATIAVAVVVITAFVLFVRSSHASIIAASERQQAQVARRVESRVLRELGRAGRVLDDLERGIRSGAVDTEKVEVLEPSLFTSVADDAHIEEVTFTHAGLLGYAPNGDARLAPEQRWQLSVYRTSTGALATKVVEERSTGFVALVRPREPDASFAEGTFHELGPASDPTLYPTFNVIAGRDRRGHATWSDLHWSEIDNVSPDGKDDGKKKRVVVTVRKGIEDRSGRFLGVLRVAIVTTELDAIARTTSETPEPEDVQRVALLATAPEGDAVHLVARVDPSDRMVTIGSDIRVVSDHPPPEIAALFASPIVRGLDRHHPNADGSLNVDGAPWLATLREIDLGAGGTDGWMVAILVPEARYTGDLAAFERTFMTAFAVTLALVVGIGLLLIGTVRRGLARIASVTTRMRRFDFAKADETSPFRDVEDVMQGLERAKTVVRAMGKYVPIDLVRRLYASNSEPKLGGELAEISLVFTDIEAFTALAERLPPDELARHLGDYFAAMTTAIEASGGTIDKFVGDAVMAMWNAPMTLPDHPKMACRAVLDCMKATRELYASGAWDGLAPLVTRFGLHKARVMVGHFGAPTRLSFTALGDGVNLAARLEPLCKHYGVVTLASETIVEQAKDEFVFRRIDRVAVKGKTEPIDVYELLGAKDEAIPGIATARRYEEAFDAYLARDFERAAEMLASQEEADAPSGVLARRCREMTRQPPPVGWSGVHVAESK